MQEGGKGVKVTNAPAILTMRGMNVISGQAIYHFNTTLYTQTT